jgi:hypothetical protein
MLHSEAPELKNVIPNSWQKVTRLTAEEEQEFVQENKSILQEIEEFSEDDNILFENGFHYVMYQEIVGEDIFYRVLCTENDEPDFLSPEISFTQYLVYENKIVTRGPYNSIEVLQRYTNMIFYSIDVIQGNAKAKGVLNTAVRVRGNKKNNIRIWDNDAYRKEQLRGLSTECYYYLMSEVNKMIKDEEYATVSISASDCLVDPNIPLRYSLQNAFDGDPATSYVENTEDDLMQIDLTYANYEKIKKIAVINGYTQNLSLYNKNNRVQSIGIESLDWNEDHSYLDFQMKQEISLIDHNLSYQIANVNLPSRINVISKYNGSDYSDTCMAELNMYAEENGWMFGGME